MEVRYVAEFISSATFFQASSPHVSKFFENVTNMQHTVTSNESISEFLLNVIVVEVVCEVQNV